MRARAFFYVCAGILCLAVAYHLGARSATAQAGSTVTGFATVTLWEWGIIPPGQYPFYVMTANGDIYGSGGGGAVRIGNFWGSGGPTSATPHTLGQLRARYR